MPPAPPEDKDALQSIIARFHPPSQSKVNKLDDLEPQIDFLIADLKPPLKDEDKRRLQLLRTVWPITGKNPCILDYVASYSANLFDLGDVAELSYMFPPTWRGYNSPVDYQGYAFTDAEMAAFRAYFYDLYPTSVLRGMVKSGRVPCQPEQVKTLTVDLFTAAIDAKVDITTASTRDLTTRFLERQDEKAKPLGTQDEKAKSFTIQAIKVFQSIQRIQAIVTTTDQIGPLLSAKLTSANEIAYKDIQELNKLCPAVDVGAFTAIKDRALIIATRNEQAWLYLLKTRAADLEPVSAGSVQKPDVAVVGQVTAKQISSQISLQNLFKEVNTAGCEHCCSVLSPSAYFVDLLRFLETYKAGDDVTLQAKFFGRRGDLANLELSCANTNDLIQYIDLVHEVLQTFCVDLAKKTKEIKDVTESLSITDAGDVYFDHDLHMQVLSKMVYPLAAFPYNYATSSIEHYLRVLETSRLAVMKTFQSKYRIFDKTKVQEDAIMAMDALFEAKSEVEKRDAAARAQKFRWLFRLAETVNERAMAAQSLGLIQEEYILITDEGYFGRSATEVFRGIMTTKQYLEYIQRKPTGVLWGYTNDIEMLSQNEDEKDKIGLTFVQAEFLPRSGLSLDELVELLKTQYIGMRLILTPVLAANRFTKDADLLRLSSVPTASAPVTSLTEQVCRDLLIFIRLYRKLSWSISELDAVMSCLWRNQALQISTGPVDVDEQHIIGSRVQQAVTPDVLENISAIKQLETMTGIPILQLLTLWGQMDTFGPNSLYSSLFLQQGSARDLEVFGPNTDGDFFSQAPTVGDGFLGLANAMSLTRLELEDLLKATEVTKDMPLTLPVISKIFRYVTLAKILKTTHSQLKQLSRQPTFLRVFEGPKKALHILSGWYSLVELGWSSADIVMVCSSTSPENTSLSENRDKTSAMVAALSTTALPQANVPQSGSRDDDLTQAIIMAAIRSQNSSISETILTILVSEILRFGPGRLMSAKQYLDEVRTTGRPTAVREGYFMPLVSGTYSFDASQGSLVIDGVPLVTPNQSAALHQDKVALEKGVAYAISFLNPSNVDPRSKDLRNLSWSCLGQAALPTLGTVLATEDTVRRLQEIVDISSATIKVVTQFELGKAELRYLASTTSRRSSMSLQYLAISDLQKLQKYHSVRSSVRRVSKNEDLLLRFLRWCGESTDGDLAKWISELTSSPLQSVIEVLNHRYPSVPNTMRKKTLCDIEELDDFLRIWAFFSTTKLSITDEPLLFDIAQPPRPEKVKDEFKVAASLRNDVKVLFGTSDRTKTLPYTTVVRNIVEECRSALIQYLINHTHESTMQFTDADKLFEYFLIDVSMGPGLETSRIKQAISTVHLYMQRCILGLEAANNVSNAMIDRKVWEWMRSYQTWEANRKVFLYPENWLDPTLRDGKSELFKDFEAKIMQTNLNMDSLSQLTKSYIYSLNELSDLKVEAYLWDTSTDKKRVFHLFARTRNTPYIYYYRRLTVTWWQFKPGAASKTEIDPQSRLLRWTPWQRLDMEIQTFEEDSEGQTLARPGTYLIPAVKNDRIFLFNPQILLKTRPNKVTQQKKISDMANTQPKESSPEKYWEIRMSWTELRNGEWSAKKVSQASINVESLPYGSIPGGLNDFDGDFTLWRFPAIDSFKFWVRTANAEGTIVESPSGIHDILVIDIETQFRTHGHVPFPTAAFTLGRFEMREYDIIARKGTEVPGTWNANSVWPGRSNWVLEQMFGADKTFQQVIAAQEEAVVKAKEEQAARELKAKEEREAREVAQHTAANGEGVGVEYVPARVSIMNPIINQLFPVTNGPAVDYSAVPRTVRTQFSQLYSKLSRASDARPNDSVTHLKQTNKPFLGEMKWTETIERQNIWVMSFDDTQASRPTGLVVDVVTSNRGSQRYICLPDDDDFTKATDPITGIKLNNKLAPHLMKNAVTPANIDKLYAAFSTPGGVAKDIDAYFGGSKDPVFHERAAPYSIYNWEIGYHMVALVMERFLATQQLELALHVARYIFDPTVPGGNTTNCWRFPPFQNPALVGKESPAQIVEKLDPKEGSNFAAAVSEWRENPFSPHVVARNYPKAYMKRTVRKYIEILIASGDQYFRQLTLESLPLAIQRYVEASHLFGERPKTFNSLSKSKPRTYNGIKEALNSFNNSVVDLELEFPFKRLPKWRSGKTEAAKDATSLMGVLQTGYFCVPANPELVRLRDLIDDRLYKIRNCQDINGKGIKLKLFEPSLDPGALIQAQAAGISISSFLADRDAPFPKSRFAFLLSRALEMCGDLKSMGDEYLSIKEKRDSEALMVLRQTQERSITTMSLDVKKMQRDEALRTLESLEETRRGHETRLSYFLQLAGENVKVPRQGQDWTDLSQDYDSPAKDELRMTATEKIESDRANEAAGYNQKASILETVAGVLMALPRATVNAAPIGCGVSIQWDGSVAGHLLMTTAGVLKIIGMMKMDESVRAQRRSQLIRQLQDRRMQANTAGRDIVVLDKQIAAQKIRLKMSESELRIQEAQIEHANEISAFYRTKYTNEKLYAWMDNTFCKIYQDTYDLASTMARTAQRAFEYESHGPEKAKNQFLKSTGYWDRSRDGMFSARNLYLDLKRMEWDFCNKTYHDFEITKSVSLRQINAYQLLRLRYERKAEFNLTEILFDADFPGQYLRRLKSVAVSIPCIVGPYTSINCTLTLTRNQIRVKDWTKGDDKAEDKLELPMDAFPITSIAVSHGRSDTGMFDMNFGGNSDRYGPFEGAGAISDWRLELPSPVPQFDYTTISDVVIQVRYTAKAASVESQKLASTRVKQFMSDASKSGSATTSLFDIKNDFPDEWRRLTRPVSGSNEIADEAELSLKGLSQRLPFWTKGLRVTAKKTVLVIASEDEGFPDIKLNGDKVFTPNDSKIESKANVRTVANKSDIPVTDDWKLKIVKQGGKGKLSSLFMIVQYQVSGLDMGA